MVNMEPNKTNESASVDPENPSQELLDDLMKSILRHMLTKQSSPYALYEYLTQTHSLSLVLMQSHNFLQFLPQWCKAQLPNVKESLRMQREKKGESEESWESLTKEQRDAIELDVFRETLSLVSVMSNFFSLLSDFPLGQAARYQEESAASSRTIDRVWHVRVSMVGLRGILDSSFFKEEVEKKSAYSGVVARMHSQLSALMLTLADADGSLKVDEKMLFLAKLHCMEALKRINAKQLPNEYAVNRQQMALILKKEGNYAKALEEFERVIVMREGEGKVLTSVNMANCLAEHAEHMFNASSTTLSLDNPLEKQSLCSTPVDQIQEHKPIMDKVDRAIVLLREAAKEFSEGQDHSRASVTWLNLAQTLIRKCKILFLVRRGDGDGDKDGSHQNEIRDTLQAMEETISNLITSSTHTSTKSKSDSIPRIKVLEGELHYYRYLLHGTEKQLIEAMELMQSIFDLMSNQGERATGSLLYYKIVRHLSLFNTILAEKEEIQEKKEQIQEKSAMFLKRAIESRRQQLTAQQSQEGTTTIDEKDSELENLSKQLEDLKVQVSK